MSGCPPDKKIFLNSEGGHNMALYVKL
jgi:hypothetical protein